VPCRPAAGGTAGQRPALQGVESIAGRPLSADRGDAPAGDDITMLALTL